MSGSSSRQEGAGVGPQRSIGEMSFEELVEELSAVTAQMDDGAIGIERAADLYERASALHAAASARLVGVEARLDELRGKRS